MLRVDERLPVAFHLTRFVGYYFLVLYARGLLPSGFAVVGGWGDITVAVLALGLLAIGRAAPGRRRVAYIVWNALGLIDILFAVGAATRSGARDFASMRPLLVLPLNLLLTYDVPIVIVTHLVLAYRLTRGNSGTA